MKIRAYIFIFVSMLVFAPRLLAWSDGVSGVLMPSPRGGGGISSSEAYGAMSTYDEGEDDDPQVQAEWE